MLFASYGMIWISLGIIWLASGRLLLLPGAYWFPQKRGLNVLLNLLLFLILPWITLVGFLEWVAMMRGLDLWQQVIDGGWQSHFPLTLISVVSLFHGHHLWRFWRMGTSGSLRLPALILLPAMLLLWLGITWSIEQIHGRFLVEKHQTLLRWQTLQGEKVGKEADGFLVYEQIIGDMVAPTWLPDLDQGRFTPGAEEKRWLYDNESQLDAVVEASGRNDLIFQVQIPHEYSDPLPLHSKVKTAARMLYLDSRIAAMEGDSERSLQRIRDISAMARQVGSAPSLLCAMVSVSLQNMATTALERSLFDIDSTRIKTPLNDGGIENYAWLSNSLRRGMIGEVCSMQYALEQWGSDYLSSDITTLYFGRAYLLFFGFDDLLLVQTFWEPFLKNEALLVPGQFISEHSRRLITPLHSVAFSSYGQFEGRIKRAQSGALLAELAMAATHFRAQYGQFPQELGQLGKAIPIDAFGKPVRMKWEPEGLILYSTGPDGIDDGAGDYGDQEEGVAFFLGSSFRQHRL